MSSARLKKQCVRDIENISDDEFLQVVYALLKNKTRENKTSMNSIKKGELDRSLEKNIFEKKKYYTSAQV